MNNLPKEYAVLGDGTIVFEQEVLQSNAGWYVGRRCKDPEFGFIAPYCRDSEYDTEEGARKLLALWQDEETL